MFMNRDSFLADTELKTDVVDLPSGKLRLMELDASDYMDVCDMSKLDGSEEEDGTYKLDITKFNPLMLARSIVDKNGERMFSDDEAGLLIKRSKKHIRVILDKIRVLNGLIGDEKNDSNATVDDSNFGE